MTFTRVIGVIIQMKGERVLSESVGSNLLRRHIGRWFTTLRESAGLSQDAAAMALQRGSATIWRLEAGDARVRFRDPDVIAMCDLYRASPEVKERLLALTGDTRIAAKPRKAWWHDYTDTALPPWFGLYVTLEDNASMIRQYEQELVPGLLQTRAYAEEITRVPPGYVDEEEVHRRVDVRMERQALLTSPRPPHLLAILNQAVIDRPVGGRNVMADQLLHLLSVTERYCVSVRILPYEAGGHGAMASAFAILDFPTAPLSTDPVEPSLAYVDTLTGALYLNKTDEVRAYEMAWADLASRALDEPSSRKLIIRSLEAYTSG